MRNASIVYHQLTHWAEKNQNIRALILTGSRANPNAFVDLLSDYDVEVFVAKLDPFLKSDEWLATFGAILACWPPSPAKKDQRVTRLALFDDGIRIDFQIATAEMLKQMLQLAQLPASYDNGYTILLDKDGLTESIPLPTYKAYQPTKPMQEEYLSVVHDFWWDSTYVAKSLWRAVNPNKQGRWFKRYLDPETWREIKSTFAGAAIEENWQALFNMTALFRRIAQEIALALGYAYPFELDERVTAYLVRVRNLGILAKVSL